MREPPCRVCAHPEKALIDVGLASRHSIKGMAARFNVSTFSLYRHRHAHLPPQVIAKILEGLPYAVANLEELRETESERLLANAVTVRSRLYSNADAAEKVGDFKAATQAYGMIINSLNLIGKLLNQFVSHSRTVTNNLVISPDYLKLRARLIQALEPYPEARQAVARVLREVEAVEVNVNGQSGT